MTSQRTEPCWKSEA